ncbi:MAG: class I SAM-dependent methyltransferase [Burkholderiales bacterium]
MNHEAVEPRQSHAFYESRYAPGLQTLQDVIFREVYDDYIGQSSWIATADYDRFIGWLDVAPDAQVLDVACGRGALAVRLACLAGCSVVGIDNNALAIARGALTAHEQGLSERVRLEHCDGSQPLPFSSGMFDALVCIDALALLPDRTRLFAEWARVLKPGGRLLLTNPVMTGAISNEEIAARTSQGHFLLVPPGYDERIVGEAGFALLRREDITTQLAEIARRHSAARAAHADRLRETEGEEEFAMQNRYRAVAARLASERRLSHIVYLARKQTSGAIAVATS